MYGLWLKIWLIVFLLWINIIICTNYVISTVYLLMMLRVTFWAVKWWCLRIICILCFCSVSASVSMSARPECRWAMRVGSCTVWSTESSLMVRCRVTRPLEVETTPSTRSSVRLGQANTCLVLSSLTWSPLLLVSVLINSSCHDFCMLWKTSHLLFCSYCILYSW